MSYNIQNWDLIVTNKVTGTAKLKCPACTDTRKNKNDRSLYVNFNSGVGKCFNDGCSGLFFRDSIKKNTESKNYTLPEQSWSNYTKLSDNLVKHIESQFKYNPGMSWRNYGRGGWHIDHIIPKYWFVYESFNDKAFKKCWALSNLRPMWERLNIQK